MGADSALSASDGSIRTSSSGKCWRRNGLIIGVCGSLGFMNRLRAWCPPRYDWSAPPLEWATIYFEPELRRIVGRYRDWGIIVGVGGKALRYDATNSGLDAREGYTAIGDGEDCALAALHVLDQLGEQRAPRERLRLALKAAEAWCTSVRGPMRFVSTRPIR